MIKKIVYTFLVLGSLFLLNGAFNNLDAYDCPHTFQIVEINQIRYLYEYDCDGILVGISEIEE